MDRDDALSVGSDWSSLDAFERVSDSEKSTSKRHSLPKSAKGKRRMIQSDEVTADGLSDRDLPVDDLKKNHSKEKKKKTSNAPGAQEINNKYFKWNAGDNKGKESRHLPSHQLHLRRQRLARMYKLKPELLVQLRKSLSSSL